MIKFKLFGLGSGEKAAVAGSPTAATPETASVVDKPQTNVSSKRVLVVDDDPIFLRITATKLRSAGFEVMTARETSEAIAALRTQSADAVLMDITFQPDVYNGNMGSWDGFQLMSWLRRNPAAKVARFIMVSNSAAASDRQRARQLGAVAYFQKPLDYERLFAVVNADN